jgi:hypothetical protein
VCVRRPNVGFLLVAMRCEAKNSRSSLGVARLQRESCLSSPKENYPVNEGVLFIHDRKDEDDNNRRGKRLVSPKPHLEQLLPAQATQKTSCGRDKESGDPWFAV